jgi:hypothetical protein
MWYLNRKNCKELDYSKPIFATSRNNGAVMLLIPQHSPHDYSVIGYDWFDITDGKYNSCTCFDTAKMAVDCYVGGYEISNGTIKIVKL